MHNACWFLISPESGEDILDTQSYVFEHHDALKNRDENHWNEPMGVLCADGRRLILPEHAEFFQTTFGNRIPSPHELLNTAMRILAAELAVAVSEAENLRARILQEIPARLSELYASASRKPDSDDDRLRLSEAYEFLLNCAVPPFTRCAATPFSYRFHDLRKDRWNSACNIIRPQDAVLFMDTQT